MLCSKQACWVVLGLVELISGECPTVPSEDSELALPSARCPMLFMTSHMPVTTPVTTAPATPISCSKSDVPLHSHSTLHILPPRKWYRALPEMLIFCRGPRWSAALRREWGGE